MGSIGNRQVAGGLLGLHALTAVHPGSGAALGTVDLPVQRERQNDWPNIAGSALKGILRDAAREHLLINKKGGKREEADRDAGVLTLFGASKQHGGDENAGALSITDARMLAFPLRSLLGGFAWVTCPAAIDRLRRDCSLAGLAPPEWKTSAGISDGHAVVDRDSPLLIDKKYVQLDDETFERQDGDAAAVGQWIAKHLLPQCAEYESTRARLPKGLVVVNDTVFTHFVKFATEISARIGLDYESKTVKEGALFYQEFIPAEAIFYSVLLANTSRRGTGENGRVLLKQLSDIVSATGALQIGGDETTGKGFCATRMAMAEVN